MKQISGRKFAKILENHGWTCKRISGSHHIYTKPGNRAALSIPIHKSENLKTGLLRSLMDQAGLTDSDLD
jgi:predicted RNA binding protein YcfA (HicA-like mRNA interferase family)